MGGGATGGGGAVGNSQHSPPGAAPAAEPSARRSWAYAEEEEVSELHWPGSLQRTMLEALALEARLHVGLQPRTRQRVHALLRTRQTQRIGGQPSAGSPQNGSQSRASGGLPLGGETGGELLGAAELVHVDVGVGGGEPRVVLRPGAHHYRQHPVSEQCRLQ